MCITARAKEEAEAAAAAKAVAEQAARVKAAEEAAAAATAKAKEEAEAAAAAAKIVDFTKHQNIFCQKSIYMGPEYFPQPEVQAEVEAKVEAKVEAEVEVEAKVEAKVEAEVEARVQADFGADFSADFGADFGAKAGPTGSEKKKLREKMFWGRRPQKIFSRQDGRVEALPVGRGEVREGGSLPGENIFRVKYFGPILAENFGRKIRRKISKKLQTAEKSRG